MKHLIFSAALALLSLTASAQLYCGWNPDSNGDGAIGAPDLLALLGVYDLPNWDANNGPAECGGVSTVAYDGYDYDLVVIGGVCWFAENLRSAYYANGDAIPGYLTDAEWTATTEGAQDVFNSDDAGDFNLPLVGRLYNWHAVNDPRGVCPAGWHVPSVDEWNDLLSVFGGSSEAGSALKASPSDDPAWDGTNSSGFTALAGGLRSATTGYFGNIWSYGFFWSSTPEDATDAFSFSMLNNTTGVYSNGTNMRSGLSVRCIH